MNKQIAEIDYVDSWRDRKMNEFMKIHKLIEK